MSEIALGFENIVKNYGQHTVLSNISLSIKQGESLGLVGVNGAGKTTLIKYDTQ